MLRTYLPGSAYYVPTIFLGPLVWGLRKSPFDGTLFGFWALAPLWPGALSYTRNSVGLGLSTWTSKVPKRIAQKLFFCVSEAIVLRYFWGPGI